MFLDLSPLKQNKDFRYVYIGQLISFLGAMLTYVAIPYQVYELTHSTLAVGLIAIAELIPLLVTVFIGGVLADTMDKRKLLILSEIGMGIGCAILLVNALLPQSYLWAIFAMAAGISALNGLHRPTLDALVPRTVQHHEIQAVSILSSLKFSIGLIGGPALAGLCIAYLGLAWTYVIDACTFIFSIAALSQIGSYKAIHEDLKERVSLKNIKEAFRYAFSRQELFGTYVIDFFAMVFAMPNALFPAVAALHGGSKVLGWLYAMPAVGSLIITVFSGWTHKITRHGQAVAIAALLWGTSMIAVGLSPSIYGILFFLTCAGAADCVSGIFRLTIWNETIPDNIRGRMASLEVVSYTGGPLLGNAQAGLMASIVGTKPAITLGGSISAVTICVALLLLPRFWRYRKQPAPQKENS